VKDSSVRSDALKKMIACEDQTLKTHRESDRRMAEKANDEGTKGMVQFELHQ
jgi:hypothetical protein